MSPELLLFTAAFLAVWVSILACAYCIAKYLDQIKTQLDKWEEAWEKSNNFDT